MIERLILQISVETGVFFFSFDCLENVSTIFSLCFDFGMNKRGAWNTHGVRLLFSFARTEKIDILFF